MNNKVLISLVAIILIVFSGCSIPGFDGRQSGLLPTGGSDTPKSSGNGIELSFSENNPPSSMYKDQKTTFGFIFTNSLEHEVSDLKLKVSGFDKNYVSGLEPTIYSIDTIPRYTQQTGPGVYAGFMKEDVQFQNVQNEFTFNTNFDYCYTAHSKLLEQVCIPDGRSNVCEVENAQGSSAQNGHLNIDVESLINKDDNTIRAFITITNKANGEVKNECFEDDYSKDFKSVEATLGTSAGECFSTSGKMNIIQGSASFYCDFPRTSDDSYISQLSLDLEYLYEQALKKTITVKDINQGFN